MRVKLCDFRIALVSTWLSPFLFFRGGGAKPPLQITLPVCVCCVLAAVSKFLSSTWCYFVMTDGQLENVLHWLCWEVNIWGSEGGGLKGGGEGTPNLMQIDLFHTVKFSYFQTCILHKYSSSVIKLKSYVHNKALKSTLKYRTLRAVGRSNL